MDQQDGAVDGGDVEGDDTDIKDNPEEQVCNLFYSCMLIGNISNSCPIKWNICSNGTK